MKQFHAGFILLSRRTKQLRIMALLFGANMNVSKFPFGQPDKTRDCGYRCLYYVLNLNTEYNEWVKNFRFFTPTKSGILFQDICNVLSYYGKKYKFTQLTEKGVFVIYSGIWLHVENKKHGHYFVYDNGHVLCSTHLTTQRMKLETVVKRLEADTVDLAFRCLRVEE